MCSGLLKVEAGLVKETYDLFLKNEIAIPCMTIILIIELKWPRDQKLGKC